MTVTVSLPRVTPPSLSELAKQCDELRSLLEAKQLQLEAAMKTVSESVSRSHLNRNAFRHDLVIEFTRNCASDGVYLPVHLVLSPAT